jgi:hypothetical protein
MKASFSGGAKHPFRARSQSILNRNRLRIKGYELAFYKPENGKSALVCQGNNRPGVVSALLYEQRFCYSAVIGGRGIRVLMRGISPTCKARRFVS